MTITEDPPVDEDPNDLLIGDPCWTEDGLRLRYTPQAPHPKQGAFLATTCLELFFGGSGGPGKSWALLASALQFCDVPGYSALILRRTLAELTASNALIDMSKLWLERYPNATYNANEHKWTFDLGPGLTPATLQFGYLAHENHLERYRGTEYQFIGFDELGGFPEEGHYTFLFSRLRRPAGLTREEVIDLHGGTSPDGLTILDVPLRCRSASNPGGQGMAWVKRRFVEADPGEETKAPYLPATYRDNPSLDAAEYEASLAKLTEVERRRMGDGDWAVQEVPGALWKMEIIKRSDWSFVFDPEIDRSPDAPPRVGPDTSAFDSIVVGIDPTVGEGAGDECGIVACGQYPNGQVVVLADESFSAHPDDWSRTAVLLYHTLGADRMIAEQNNGGEALATQINNAARLLELPRPNLALRSAVGSKAARAATVRTGYVTSPPSVVHSVGLMGGQLEAQCFTGDTRIVTRTGFARLDSFEQDEAVTVVAGDGEWRPAIARCYGEDRIWRLVVSRYGAERVIETTHGHGWFVAHQPKWGGKAKVDPKEFSRKLTEELSPGDVLVPRKRRSLLGNVREPDPVGVMCGYVYGDGHTQTGGRSSGITFYGNDISEIGHRFFDHYMKHGKDGFSLINQVPCVSVGSLPRFFNEEPDPLESAGFLYGWLAGYYAADGWYKAVGGVGITSTDPRRIDIARWVAMSLGIEVSSVSVGVNKPRSLRGRRIGTKPLSYSFTMSPASLREDFFLSAADRNRFLSCTHRELSGRWKVVSAEPTARIEPVYCLEVPGDGRFVLADTSILTSNCVGWVPGQSKDSPDRIDALVWAARELLYPITEKQAEKDTLRQKMRGKM